MQAAFSDALAAVKDELSVELAVTPGQVLEAQRLRHRVYCEERNFEPGQDGLEQDAFDAASRHVLVRSRISGAVLGTVRVVLRNPAAGRDSFPMQAACKRHVLAPLPLATTGEISRFALTRDRTGVSPAASALLRLCLMQGVVRISAEHGLTHWCAIMESSLLRLLRATAIYFRAVGPTVEYHGLRQPSVGKVGMVLDRMKHEQPLVWSFVTANGAFCSEIPLPELVQAQAA